MSSTPEPALISRSVLCQLAYEGSVEKLELSLEGFTDHYASLIALDSNDRNSLHWASLSGNINMIKLLIQKHHIPVNYPDGLGWTSLMISVSAGRTQAAIVLLDLGSDVSVRNKHGQTALHFAVAKNRNELTDEILSRSNDADKLVNISDIYGITSLHRAVSVASKEIVQRLLRAGALVEIKDIEGNTALHLAALEGRVELISLILQNNIELVRTRNKEGQLPLDMAVEPEIRRLLLPY